jgi:cyanophycinase-like exopeptidase
VLTAKDVFTQTQEAALRATNEDEKPLQIDYSALETKIERVLAGRTVEILHINQFLPDGYEDQGRFNVIVITPGNVLFDMVFGDSYFRYDVFSCCDLDKIQLIDGTWDNKEAKLEESFLSLRLMHGDEAHILLALKDDQRPSVLAFAEKVAQKRHPEKTS